MLELRQRGVLYFLQRYYGIIFMSLGLAAGFGVLLHTTINATLLAGDRSVVNFGENSERVAGVSIPVLSVDAPVFEVGVVDDNRVGVTEMRSNVGWFREGEELGLSRFLVGHSPGVFANLQTLEEGEMIVFRKSSDVKLYKVEEVLIKYRAEINMAEELLWQGGIVLMTCYGERIGDDYTHRVIVRARKL